LRFNPEIKPFVIINAAAFAVDQAESEPDCIAINGHAPGILAG
jgi:dTDP-4-dehydrorhamnose reductase